ncbi:hypothetical protein XSR1_420021 [Xenorhabdus szentirmaii DSM 16338]|uniref:Uncharacterized protein n=1 Tax=Xenorhabdus szentirmaii DSM 16338 TaxID=1427518 RepID=W1J321_9GAMM|nr:hypothetical protein XSR1_420021 [Xenorhabdus szentirmaii DSM 16338]
MSWYGNLFSRTRCGLVRHPPEGMNTLCLTPDYVQHLWIINEHFEH